MKQLERTFSQSERIIAKAKFSYWVFLREFFIAIILGGIIAVLWIFKDDINGLIDAEILTDTILKYVLAGAAVLVLLLVLIEAICRSKKEVIITDKKFVSRQGVLEIEDIQMPLDQIKIVQFKQSSVGRIFHYGKVIVVTDAMVPIVLKGVVQPDRFAQCITRQKSRSEIDNSKKFMLQLVPNNKKRNKDRY